MLKENERSAKGSGGRLFHCPMDLTMNYIGGKWKSVVLWYLIGGKRRFNELKKLIPGITEKMLSIQLRRLEKDGFIVKKIFAELPPRVEYRLTEEGKTLVPVLKAMSGWGMRKGKMEGKLAKKFRVGEKN